MINGVRLGTDPTPVLHGDKIQIGGHEILVVDSRRSGHTQLFDSGAFADLAPPPPAVKPPVCRQAAAGSSASPTGGSTPSGPSRWCSGGTRRRTWS